MGNLFTRRNWIYNPQSETTAEQELRGALFITCCIMCYEPKKPSSFQLRGQGHPLTALLSASPKTPQLEGSSISTCRSCPPISRSGPLGEILQTPRPLSPQMCPGHLQCAITSCTWGARIWNTDAHSLTQEADPSQRGGWNETYNGHRKCRIQVTSATKD